MEGYGGVGEGHHDMLLDEDSAACRGEEDTQAGDRWSRPGAMQTIREEATGQRVSM